MWSLETLKAPVKGGSTIVAAAIALGGLFVLAHPLRTSDAQAGTAASLADPPVLAKPVVSAPPGGEPLPGAPLTAGPPRSARVPGEPLPGEPLPGPGPDVRETVADVLDAFEADLADGAATCSDGLASCVAAGGCGTPGDAHERPSAGESGAAADDGPADAAATTDASGPAGPASRPAAEEGPTDP